jgi:hypothetical protein
MTYMTNLHLRLALKRLNTRNYALGSSWRSYSPISSEPNRAVRIVATVLEPMGRPAELQNRRIHNEDIRHGGERRHTTQDFRAYVLTQFGQVESVFQNPHA